MWLPQAIKKSWNQENFSAICDLIVVKNIKSLLLTRENFNKQTVSL